jgi:hypothetical protein
MEEVAIFLEPTSARLTSARDFDLGGEPGLNTQKSDSDRLASMGLLSRRCLAPETTKPQDKDGLRPNRTRKSDVRCNMFMYEYSVCPYGCAMLVNDAILVAVGNG